jgi:hypothetical protein
LRSEKEGIDNEVAEIERMVEVERQNIMTTRHNKLISAGAALIGNEYIWQSSIDLANSLCLPSINIETLYDDDFQKEVDLFHNTISVDKAIIHDRKLAEVEEKRKSEEQRDAMIKEQQRMADEINEFKITRTKIRAEYLFSLGLIPIGNKENIFAYKNYKAETISVISNIDNLDSDDWQSKMDDLQKVLADLKKADAEGIKEMQELEEKRIEEDRLRVESLAQESAEELQRGRIREEIRKEEEGETMNISFTGIKYPSFSICTNCHIAIGRNHIGITVATRN